jgi:hypothetical protein
MAPDLGTGWWTYIKYDQEHDRPKMSWALLRRVWGYAKPYRLKVAYLAVRMELWHPGVRQSIMRGEGRVAREAHK